MYIYSKNNITLFPKVIHWNRLGHLFVIKQYLQIFTGNVNVNKGILVVMIERHLRVIT